MPAKKPTVKLVCAVCLRQYEVMPYRASISKCCSKLCAQKYAARFAAHIQEAKRGTGTKHRYVKRGGRHEHRVVAEMKLGRPLGAGEVVHHIDGNGHNNNPDNLQVMTQSEHMRLHLPEMAEAKRSKGERV